MYGIHVEVPSGVSQLEVSLDFLATPGDTGSDEDGATSANMTVLEWNSVVLYPAHIPVAQIPIAASLTVPADWKLGTALTIAAQKGLETSFAPVSVEQLVDSPVITGRYFREIPIGSGDHTQALPRRSRRRRGRCRPEAGISRLGHSAGAGDRPALCLPPL